MCKEKVGAVINSRILKSMYRTCEIVGYRKDIDKAEKVIAGKASKQFLKNFFKYSA